MEDGASSPATVLNAITEREKVIAELEAQVRAAGEVRVQRKLDVPTEWQHQLSDLAGVLKDDIVRVKSEFRRLNLALTFHPVDGDRRPHYVVKGQ